MWINILAVSGVVALLILAIFSAVFRNAIEELSRSEYSEIKSKGTTASTMVVRLLDNEERSLSALEVATFTFQGFALLLALWLYQTNVCLVSPWYTLVLVVSVLLFILLSVILVQWIPRYYAKEREVGIVSRNAIMIQFFVWLFKPSAHIAMWMQSNYSRANNTNALSGDEMSDVIEIAEGGEDVETETQMLKGIVRFSDLVVSEIMKSRMDIVAVEIGESLDNVIALYESTGFSRIPVYEGSIDNVKGVLYVKDLLSVVAKGNGKSFEKLVRKPFFVPETKHVNDLLHEFQTRKIHMAIVVDEYGGTSGLVTLEDIIEEIVGEISDEYDKTEETFHRLPDDSYIVEAKTSIIDFCKFMGLSDEAFDEIRGDAETLAGLILEVVGEIPREGTNVKVDGFTFKIQKADNRHIEQVQVIADKNDTDEEN